MNAKRRALTAAGVVSAAVLLSGCGGSNTAVSSVAPSDSSEPVAQGIAPGDGSFLADGGSNVAFVRWTDDDARRSSPGLLIEFPHPVTRSG
jgi:hypothetical protein